jgi:hypothetical protein
MRRSLLKVTSGRPESLLLGAILARHCSSDSCYILNIEAKKASLVLIDYGFSGTADFCEFEP